MISSFGISLILLRFVTVILRIRSRYATCAEYDAQWEYDKWFSNPLLPLRQLVCPSYVQTDELRSKYDTIEMVDSMLDKEYISR